jgi:hypothetical protein
VEHTVHKELERSSLTKKIAQYEQLKLDYGCANAMMSPDLLSSDNSQYNPRKLGNGIRIWQGS